MHIHRTLLRLLGALTLTGASIAAGATVTAPDNGDIFLGVRASGGQGSGVSLLINVGDDTAFRNAAAGSTLALANVSTELTTAFGAGWSTRSDLTWAFFGARNQTNPVVYATRAQSPAGLPATSYPAQDLSQRTATKNQIISVVDAYTLLDQFSGNANGALQTNGLNSGSYSFQVGSAGTSDFGSLSQWVSIEGDFSAGVSGTVLDFFRYAGSTTVPATERLGSFEISSSGALSFTRSLAPGTAGIRFAQSAVSVDEDAGTVALTFRRTDDVSAAVSATFSTNNGSATSGTDYTAQTNVTVNFGIGEFQKTVTVPIVDRPGISAARDFTVTLANASVGAELVSPISATVTINDTDSEVEFASATASLRALDVLSQPNTIELTVNRSGDLTDAASVNASISGGSLTSGTHFTFTSPTLVQFAYGDATETVSIPLNAIPSNALPGTIIVSLTSPVSTSLGTLTSSTITVLPNSGEIAFTSSTFTAPAVTAANVPSVVTFNLARSNGTVGAASVNVAVTGGTLVSGTHFVPLDSPTTITFADGSATASLNIQLNAIGTGLLANGATIELGLSSPTNSATLGSPSTSTVTIVGTPGTISIAAASYNVREEIGVFQLPLTRIGGTSGAVSVTINTTAGTAAAGTDFTAITGQVVNFADGVASVNVPITILNTVANEPNELFTVAISAPAGGAALGTTTTASIRILDADVAAPVLTVTAPKTGAKVAAPNSTVNVVGSAKENKEVASIQLQLNGAAAVSVPFTLDAKGVPVFNFPVTAQRGTNIVVLRAYDYRGNASAPVSATFIYDDPFAALAGAYKGLARASGATVPSHSNNGFVDIQVVAAGSFSGKLTIDGLVLPFTGVIGNNGTARIGATGADKFRVERPNKPAFEISFALNLTSRVITGTVTEYRRSVAVGTAALTAQRAGFGKTVSVAPGYLQNKGAYTLILPPQVQSSAFTAQDYPQGDGVGTATVKADGTVSFAGTLADGTKFTASSLLWANLTLPLYVELYSKAGSLGGTITFNDQLPTTDFSGSDLFWFRPYQNVQHYPYGWPEGLATIIHGAKYAVGSTSSLGTLPAANATLGNAQLEFTGGLLSEDVIKAVNLDVKYKVTNAPVTDKSFSLTVTQTSGLFTGKFTHTDGTQPAFNGVIYQKGSLRLGYGHFLSTTPRVRDGTGEAGIVTLAPRAN